MQAAEGHSGTRSYREVRTPNEDLEFVLVRHFYSHACTYNTLNHQFLVVVTSFSSGQAFNPELKFVIFEGMRHIPKWVIMSSRDHSKHGVIISDWKSLYVASSHNGPLTDN